MITTKERVFLELCRFLDPDVDYIKKNIRSVPQAELLGMIQLNRMSGVVYKTMSENNLLKYVDREFRNVLEASYETNILKNRVFYDSVRSLVEGLGTVNQKYAMLKGAILCGLYPEGMRTSNDIDLLVSEKDITEIGDNLKQCGFEQGYIINGNIEKANRRDVIEARLTRGETVPFVRRNANSLFKFTEVDMNFSVDYKASAGTEVEEIISHSDVWNIGGIRIPAPSKVDFFIHLCFHLYKELTTFPWIKMGRDMTLYKFCDIYMMLNNRLTGIVSELFDRAYKLKCERIVSCVILWTNELLPIQDQEMISRAKEIEINDPEDLYNTVYDPENKRVLKYIYRDICDRFFRNNRESLLAVKRYETYKNDD